MLLRRIEFENKAVVFLRPVDLESQMMDLTAAVKAQHVVIEGMNLETAAAWSMANVLFCTPHLGTA